MKLEHVALAFPAFAAATSDGTNNLSPGPKMLLGRIQHVRSPFLPLAFTTSFSPSALVSEYESLNWCNITTPRVKKIKKNKKSQTEKADNIAK